ncbi:MAG TPA: NrfD/PsrC family molybdoenzyme membrane anchor subunit [Chloroflexota bacterium]
MAHEADAYEEAPVLSDEQINRDILRPIMYTDWRFFLVVGVLGLVVLWALFAFGWQLYWGMGVNGYTQSIFWAMFIINFVFWIGLSHSGTLISAILRVTHAEWRRPITRGAEVMTVLTLSMGALFPIIHVGRNWRLYYVIFYPNERTIWPDFRSPLLWDFAAISTYLTSSLIYLYLPMIPDLALLRDKMPTRGFRKLLYTVLSLGWRGTEREWRRLRVALALMAFVIIPIAVSVHSIVSWDFAMSIVPLWHSTIFAPYFVIGAIYSGTALVVTIMVLLRWVFHLEAYLTRSHFDNLCKILLAVAIAWTYFYFAEFLTTWYGRIQSEYRVVLELTSGVYAPFFYAMILFNFVIPFGFLIFPRVRRTIPVIFVISLLINVGMYIERFLIVIPGLSRSEFPFLWANWTPTWVEISITVGTFAGFTLLYILFTKFFPVVAIWEYKEGQMLRSHREIAGTQVVTVAKAE